MPHNPITRLTNTHNASDSLYKHTTIYKPRRAHDVCGNSRLVVTHCVIYIRLCIMPLTKHAYLFIQLCHKVNEDGIELIARPVCIWSFTCRTIAAVVLSHDDSGYRQISHVARTCAEQLRCKCSTLTKPKIEYINTSIATDV